MPMTQWHNWEPQWTEWMVQFHPNRKVCSANSLLLVNFLKNYTIPSEKEDYIQPATDSQSTRSNLRMFPPPMFSRQNIFQNYKCVFSFPGGLYWPKIISASGQVTCQLWRRRSTRRPGKRRRGGSINHGGRDMALQPYLSLTNLCVV